MTQRIRRYFFIFISVLFMLAGCRNAPLPQQPDASASAADAGPEVPAEDPQESLPSPSDDEEPEVAYDSPLHEAFLTFDWNEPYGTYNAPEFYAFSVCFSDLDNDGQNEILLSENRGGFNYYGFGRVYVLSVAGNRIDYTGVILTNRIAEGEPFIKDGVINYYKRPDGQKVMYNWLVCYDASHIGTRFLVETTLDGIESLPIVGQTVPEQGFLDQGILPKHYRFDADNYSFDGMVSLSRYEEALKAAGYVEISEQESKRIEQVYLENLKEGGILPVYPSITYARFEEGYKWDEFPEAIGDRDYYLNDDGYVKGEKYNELAKRLKQCLYEEYMKHQA